jgi:hypothetical protein
VSTNPTDPNNKDPNNKDGQPPAAMKSGEKPSFLSNWQPVPHENVQTAEKWVALCAQAAVEQDPRKLLELVSEINRLLDNRRNRLSNNAD